VNQHYHGRDYECDRRRVAEGPGQPGAIGDERAHTGRVKPARAASRRFLPTSPFGPPSAAPPAEQFAVQDQVTHDTYGLGRVIGVEVDTALMVNFGSCRVRIMTPCAKLTKL
jgi:hypothetical protein